jgi:signal peptidase I
MRGTIRGSILAVLLLITLGLMPFRLLKISGQSMEPTLNHGETYLLDQVYWRPGGLRRDDIVVVRHDEEKWVKRLVGMPGDLLQITFREDGSISDIANLTVNPEWRREAPDITYRQVDRGEIFVIGDNLNRSADSTNQGHGAFKLGHIVGIVRSFTLSRTFPFPRQQ